MEEEKTPEVTEEPKQIPVHNEVVDAILNEMAVNASVMRSTLLTKLIDPRRDIDDECGYPKEITTEQYRLMYDREVTKHYSSITSR